MKQALFELFERFIMAAKPLIYIDKKAVS